jgi:membrane protease subunit (stomatin/prohibitin family)
MYHHPGNDIMNGSLLTVESNHFCVLKSRGAILNVYETGQYPVETPQRPLIGSMQQAFYGGQSPWQYEALFVSRAKSVVKAKGLALSRELAEMVYDVDYYVHVDSPQDAVKLVTHMPYSGHVLTTEALNAYAGPVVEQSVNQLVQLTPLEQVNERIHDITELVRGHLQDFLSIYGIMLNDVKVLIRPADERMRELISLRAFGLSELDAVRYYVAMKMAERGLVSAPNMAVGLPFNIGLTGLPPAGMPGMPGVPGLGNAASGSHVPGH